MSEHAARIQAQTHDAASHTHNAITHARTWQLQEGNCIQAFSMGTPPGLFSHCIIWLTYLETPTQMPPLFAKLFSARHYGRQSDFEVILQDSRIPEYIFGKLCFEFRQLLSCIASQNQLSENDVASSDSCFRSSIPE